MGFKIAAMYPDLVEAMVVSSTLIELTKSITLAFHGGRNFCCRNLGVKLMFSVGAHKWSNRLPGYVYKDFLEV